MLHLTGQRGNDLVGGQGRVRRLQQRRLDDGKSAPDGKPLSSVLSFYFRDEVLPYYAGDDLAARDVAANDFKYWELMRRACERGLQVFDYGRSKVGTGPYAFKKNWGFEPEPLHYEYYQRRGDRHDRRTSGTCGQTRRIDLPYRKEHAR